MNARVWARSHDWNADNGTSFYRPYFHRTSYMMFEGVTVSSILRLVVSLGRERSPKYDFCWMEFNTEDLV